MSIIVSSSRLELSSSQPFAKPKEAGIDCDSVVMDFKDEHYRHSVSFDV